MNVVIINGVEYVPLVREVKKDCLVSYYEKQILKQGVLKYKNNK